MSIKTFLNKLSKPSLFWDSRKKLLAFKLMDKNPPRPIVEVGERFLKLEIDRSIIRNWVLPVSFFTLLYLGFTYIDSFLTDWKESEAGIVKILEYSEKDKNDWVEEVGNDLKITFIEYTEYMRYSSNRIGGSEIYFDIVRSIFILFGLFITCYLFLRFKRLAPLIFDRERRLLYTWRSGKALVQRYEDMQYLGNFQGLFIPLGAVPVRRKWGGKPLTEDSVGWFPFRIMPEGNIYVNDVNEYEGILAYVAQFMEYGREHVMPNAESWINTKKDYLFYEDKQPDDLEEQMSEILRRLEINRPQWLEDIKDQ